MSVPVANPPPAPPSDEAPPQPPSPQQVADAAWAMNDPDVQERYAGLWVVPYHQQIVAWGADIDLVIRQAREATSQPAEALITCAILDLNAVFSDI